LYPESGHKERDNIQHVLINNKYHASSIENFNKEKRKRQNSPKKWAKFMCVGKDIRFITKFFKSTSVKIVFTTNNTIGKRLAIEQEVPQNKYGIIGVYQLTYTEWETKYIE